MQAVLLNAEFDGVKGVAFPTSDMAAQYCSLEKITVNCKKFFLIAHGKYHGFFCKILFGTMFFTMKNEIAVKTFLGNTSIVPIAMGNTREAEKHPLEVDEFS